MANDTKFKPGQSGNPGGRIKGKPISITVLRKQIDGHLPEILASMVELAKAGDIQAAKLVLDKVLPNAKPHALPIAVPAGTNLSETGGNLINATLAGKIPPDVGAQLIAALANQSKIMEIDELAKRIEALEQHQNKTA